MKLRLSLLIVGLLLLLAVVLNACDPSEGGELPHCTPDQLLAPTNLSPHGESTLVDTAPNQYFYWGYPPTTCQPDFFELYLWTGLEPDIPGMKVRIPYSQVYAPGQWRAPWGVPLTGGKTYHWQVYAGLETGPGPDVSGPETRGFFLTGPVCASGTDYQPVLLLNPADEVVITSPTEPILFVWEDPTGCLVDYFFEFQIWSPNPEFDWGSPYLRRSQSLQSTFTRTPEQLALQDCQQYYWRIKTDPAGPPEEPFSETRAFVTNFHGGLCPMIFEKPAWILNFPQDLLCRLGPGLAYGIHRPLRVGEGVIIQGSSPDRNWWYLETDLQDGCWVPDEAIERIGGWDQFPVLEPELPDEKPRCPTDGLLAPNLQTPANAAVLTEDWPTLTWTYPDPACDPEGYRIDLSVDPTFADTSLSGGTGNPSTAWAAAHPLEDCQVYHWQVAAINDTTLGPFSESRWFRIDAESACLPLFRFNLNAFCRLGPDQAYQPLTGITPGELVEVIGRNKDNSWWHIFWKKMDVRCWVSDVTGDLIGDPGLVPVVVVDPPVTATPTDTPPEITTPPPACSSYTDSLSCSNNPSCRWAIPVTGGQAYCTEK